MALTVDQQSEEVKALAAEWPMLDALTAGTRAMRAASTSLLPKWPAEEDESYRARLATATLFPAYRRTVSVMSGKPFSKPVTLQDVPAQVEALAPNIDNQGVSLHVFAAEMFQEAIGHGFGGILIDYPKASPGQRQTVAEVERQGLRPYWVRIKHDQILGWQTQSINGRVILSQLRIAESYEEPDGPYGTAVKPQVRVLFPGGWEVWRKVGDKDEYVLFDEGTTTLKEIPFVPIYGIRKGFMCGTAPLIDLAYMNVKHWQSQSDQDTLLHVARVPILTVRGAGDKFKLVIGSPAAVNLGDNPDAQMEFVEHSGAAISAGAESLIALRDQMIESGAELLVKRQSGDVSATEAGIDAEANKCDLQRIAENFSDALAQALQYTADWLKAGDGGTVKLFSDYGAATLSDASAQLIRDLNMSGLISNETAIEEFKRRGVLSETVVAADEAEKVASQGPSLGGINGGQSATL